MVDFIKLAHEMKESNMSDKEVILAFQRVLGEELHKEMGNGKKSNYRRLAQEP